MKLSHAAPPPPLSPWVTCLWPASLSPTCLSPSCCRGIRGWRAPAGFCFHESLERARESSGNLVNTQLTIPPNFPILQPGVGLRTRISRMFSRRWLGHLREPTRHAGPRGAGAGGCWPMSARDGSVAAVALTCPPCVPHRSPLIPAGRRRVRWGRSGLGEPGARAWGTLRGDAVRSARGVRSCTSDSHGTSTF